MKDENHHVVPCPLNPLKVGFVSQFGLDYMHMACLGVMRRLLLYWKGPVGPISVRLGKKSIDKISEHVAVFACHSPVEFARKARFLDDVSKWKATEFRQFLLYSGPFVLDDTLSVVLYRHFMLLFVSFRILSCKQLLSSLYCNYAQGCICKISTGGVDSLGEAKGRQQMTANFHHQPFMSHSLRIPKLKVVHGKRRGVSSGVIINPPMPF